MNPAADVTRHDAMARLKWFRREISRSTLAMAFVLLVFPLGLVIGFITPPGQVDDEPSHMCRELALLNGAFTGERNTIMGTAGRLETDSGVWVDPRIVEASFGPVTPRTPDLFATKSSMRWSHHPIFIPVNPIAIYFPLFYLPAAIGLGSAHALGIRPYEAVYAGRLTAYLFYAAIGLFALVLARRGQAIIFLALSMPMALAIGASCNPDGMLIATTALAIALISRGAWKPAMGCMMAVILFKPPYALIALPLLLPLPPLRRWMAEHRMLFQRLILLLIAILPGVLWFTYVMVAVSAPTKWPPYRPGPLWHGDPTRIFYTTSPAANLQIVLANPRQFFLMVWVYFSVQPYLLFLWDSMVGNLGWLMILLPPSIYNLWAAGAAGALLADMLGNGAPSPSFRDSILLVVGIVITIFVIWLSQYLNWTRVGMNEIVGPSGRYLLPLLPLLGLALPRITFPAAHIIRRFALALPVIASFGTLLLVPRWLAIKFYLN